MENELSEELNILNNEFINDILNKFSIFTKNLNIFIKITHLEYLLIK